MGDKAAISRDAQKYLAKGQIDKAISEWEKLITESPDGNTYNIIGDLYLKKGDRNSAVESFRKAANYFRREGFSLKAVALYKKVLNVNTSDADALFALGELSEEKGLTTDATKYFLATADILSKEGKKDRLLDIYQKILSLSPSNIPLRNKVAEIFLKEGLHTDAAKEYLHIAGIYDDKSDVDKAMEYYRKVLDIQPQNKEAMVGIGHIYEKTGEMANALSCMKEAAAGFPEDTEVLLRYAELSFAANDDETAKENLLKIVNMEPDHLKARRLLGELYLKNGIQDKALEEYLPVIDDLILQENFDESVRLLEPFKQIDPVETGKRMVSIYRQLQDNDQAFLELGSLGDALRDRGMIDQAVACYKEALEIQPNDVRLKEAVEELAGRQEEAPPEKEAITVRITEGEKTTEEIFMEADVFSRYGLLNEAVKILEALKLREPQNINLHLKLKSLYAETSDKESLVTECIVLHELYKRKGETTNSEKMIAEALEANPDDPRLAERGAAQLKIEPTSYAEAPAGGFAEVPAGEIEDYEEELSEADFYMRQGLTQEAAKILERLHALFPQNKDVAERLINLGQLSEEGVPHSGGIEEQQFEGAAAGKLPQEEMLIVREPEEEPEVEETIIEEIVERPAYSEIIPEEPTGEIVPEEKAEQPAEKTGYEDLGFSEQDLVDAQEMPEPELDSDVLEIFQEFKKGLEGELSDEDSETHYNLGIAYKEMGLIDDAIKEFQTSRNDPKRAMQSSTMLGHCYMEKGLFSLAIDILSKAGKEVTDKDESYWAIRYELAEAYEKNNNTKEALDLYTEVFGWNAKFRNVSDKISQIKTKAVKSAEGEKPKVKKDRVSYL